jgi:MFS family permease
VPLAHPGLAGLLACATLIGLGHIFFHVSVHNLIGAYGDGDARTRNFATFSLGASISAFLGPSMTGFSIDGLGLRRPSCSSRWSRPAGADPHLLPEARAGARRAMRNRIERLARALRQRGTAAHAHHERR